VSGKPASTDRAYAAFSVCGVAGIVVSLLGFIPMDAGTAEGLGFLVALPLGVASLGGALYGIGFSLRYRRDRILLVLSATTLALVAGMFVAGTTSALLFNVLPVAYGLVVLPVTGRYFVMERRRRFRSEPE